MSGQLSLLDYVASAGPAPQRDGVHMVPYVSRTGTKSQLDLFRAWRWRLMVSAKGVVSDEGGFPFALDNGAWHCFQQKRPFDDAAFRLAVQWAAGRHDWVVIPDAVGDAESTRRMASTYLPLLAGLRPYLAVQDGMDYRDVDAVQAGIVGIFVGGSDEFKDKTMGDWVKVARDRGLKCHVGRVNTRRRLRLCVEAGADSFDGSGASRFSKHAIAVQRWLTELGVVW